MASRYSKKTRAIRRVASGSSVGAGTLRLALNKDFLVEEHRVNVKVTQGFSVAPTSVDVRDFIATIALETSDGRRCFLTGAQAYDLARFTESASVVVSTLGTTSTARYSFEIHHALDEAVHDMISALRTNELTTIDLVITFANDVVNTNGFKGGTTPAAASYAITVESIEYDMLSDVTTTDGSRGAPSKLGAMLHTSDKQEVSGTATGAQVDFQLTTGNLTRFLMLHVYNNSTASAPVLSDDILGTNIRLNVNGREIRVTEAYAIRADNGVLRAFNQIGCYVLDFGDDLTSFLDLTKVNQCRLQWDIVSGAPAWKVTLAQDYVRVGA